MEFELFISQHNRNKIVETNVHVSKREVSAGDRNETESFGSQFAIDACVWHSSGYLDAVRVEFDVARGRC